MVLILSNLACVRIHFNNVMQDVDKAMPINTLAGLGQLLKTFKTLDLHCPYGIFDPILHNSAGNDQYAFHTFLLAPDTD